MRAGALFAAVAAGLVLGAVFLANAWANARVWTARHEIADETIPAALDGYTICQISDLHNEARGADNAALLSAVRAAAPDCIVMTGDLIDSRRTDVAFALRTAEQLRKIAPVVFVPGNHEARSSAYGALEQGLRARGVAVLRDEWMPLSRGEAEIALIGLDDPGFSAGEGWTLAEGLARTRETLSALREEAGERFCVVLSHRPELLPAYADAGADLVLSGHAHGGQFRLPLLGGLFAPGQGILPRLTSGVREKGGTRLVISRGLGNSSFPLRLNNPPEIVVVTLRAKG